MRPLYLLDTNVLVHLIRQNALGQYLNANYSPLTAEPRPLISVVTDGELRSLALQWKWGSQKTDQMKFLLGYFGRVPVDTEQVLEAYAVIDAYTEGLGRSMGKPMSELRRLRSLPEQPSSPQIPILTTLTRSSYSGSGLIQDCREIHLLSLNYALFRLRPCYWTNVHHFEHDNWFLVSTVVSSLDCVRMSNTGSEARPTLTLDSPFS